VQIQKASKLTHNGRFSWVFEEEHIGIVNSTVKMTETTVNEKYLRLWL